MWRLALLLGKLVPASPVQKASSGGWEEGSPPWAQMRVQIPPLEVPLPPRGLVPPVEVATAVLTCRAVKRTGGLAITVRGGPAGKVKG